MINDRYFSPHGDIMVLAKQYLEEVQQPRFLERLIHHRSQKADPGSPAVTRRAGMSA